MSALLLSLFSDVPDLRMVGGANSCKHWLGKILNVHSSTSNIRQINNDLNVWWSGVSQTSVICSEFCSVQSNYKLSFRYFGPFPVIGKINAVTWSSASSIKFIRCFMCPNWNWRRDQHTRSIAILDHCLCQLACKLILLFVVHWSMWPPSMGTWEDEQPLKEQFPHALAWGQASVQGGGGGGMSATCHRPHLEKQLRNQVAHRGKVWQAKAPRRVQLKMQTRRRTMIWTSISVSPGPIQCMCVCVGWVHMGQSVIGASPCKMLAYAGVGGVLVV